MIWALGGAALAVSMEWWFRSQGTWPLWLVAPAIAVNYCIYRLMVNTDSLLTGIMLFSAAAAILRIAASFVLLGEGTTWKAYVRAGTYLAVSLWR